MCTSSTEQASHSSARGEAAQGPAAAAIANAVADTTGVRLRELPFNREPGRAVWGS
jgi:nicotinate dehydrogenase subunit B